MQLMSMLLLISNKRKKVSMKNFLFPFIVVSIYTGCTQIESVVLTDSIDTKQLSCSKRAQPKSLQLLEQQYRCTSQ